MVVHVVHQTAAQNISDAQVKSQIAVLNKDYRAKNADTRKVPPVWKASCRREDPVRARHQGPGGQVHDRHHAHADHGDSFGPDDTVKSKKTGGARPGRPTAT